MKKVIAAAVVVLAGAGVVGPKIVGGSVEQEYNRQFEQIPEHSGVKYEHLSFQNGWFSSTAETSLSMMFGVPELDAIKLVAVSDIKHGPVMSTADGLKTGFAYVDTTTRMEGLPEEANKFLQEHFNGSPLNVKTLTGFDMIMRSEMSVPDFTFEIPNQGAFEFGGLVSNGESDLEGKHVVADVVMKQTAIKDPSTEIVIAESSGNFEFDKYNDFIMLGGGKFTMPKVDIKTMLAAVSLENLSIEVVTEEVESKINVKEIIAIEKIIAPLPVTATSYEIEIKKLEPAAVEKWYEFSMDMNKMMTASQTAGANQLPDFDEQKIRDLISAVLVKGLELNQLFILEGLGGKISADLDVTYVGLPDGLHPMDVQDPMQMLAAVDVNLVIEADEQAIMQTPAGMMAGPYIQQGFIVQENGKLVTRSKITGGQMTLNGNPFPIEMLLGSAGGAQQGAPEEQPMDEEMPQ